MRHEIEYLSRVAARWEARHTSDRNGRETILKKSREGRDKKWGPHRTPRWDPLPLFLIVLTRCLAGPGCLVRCLVFLQMLLLHCVLLFHLLRLLRMTLLHLLFPCVVEVFRRSLLVLSVLLLLQLLVVRRLPGLQLLLLLLKFLIRLGITRVGRRKAMLLHFTGVVVGVVRPRHVIVFRMILDSRPIFRSRTILLARARHIRRPRFVALPRVMFGGKLCRFAARLPRGD